MTSWTNMKHFTHTPRCHFPIKKKKPPLWCLDLYFYNSDHYFCQNQIEYCNISEKNKKNGIFFNGLSFERKIIDQIHKFTVKIYHCSVTQEKKKTCLLVTNKISNPDQGWFYSPF